MAKEIINPASMATPTGYSYAVKKAGTPVYISGQVAQDSAGNLVGKGDAGAQAEQVMQNLRAVCEAAGGTLDDIVRITVYVTDLAYRPAVGAVRLKYFSEGSYPGSTFVVVSSLATPDYLVEIEAIAVV